MVGRRTCSEVFLVSVSRPFCIEVHEAGKRVGRNAGIEPMRSLEWSLPHSPLRASRVSRLSLK